MRALFYPSSLAGEATFLGDWTANLIRVGRIQLVLAVSEPTRLGIVVDAAPYRMIPDRLGHRLFKILLMLGVPADDAAQEAEALRTAPIAASNSRSVLGTLNQFAWQLECDLHYGLAASAAELTRQLAETIVLKPEHILHPADRVREAFGHEPIDRRHQGDWTLFFSRPGVGDDPLKDRHDPPPGPRKVF